MKQKMILTVCLAVLGMLSVKAQQSIIALHHQGNVTIFASANFQKALDTSENGDTIYLSSGTYSSDITWEITKPITLIGTGMDTKITSLSIAIPDSVTLTNRILQNLDIVGNVTIDKPIAGVQISQCRFNSIYFKDYTLNAVIDRCVCNNTFYLRHSSSATKSNAYNLLVTSCKIASIYGSCGTEANDDVQSISFVNCNISKLKNNEKWRCVAEYKNCAILSWQTTSSTDHNPATTYINCLCGNGCYTYSVNQGCWTNASMVFDDDMNLSFTDDSKLENYIGTDGTVVGCTGGILPFTLIPAAPRVLEGKVEVNEIGTELKVTLKVGTE